MIAKVLNPGNIVPVYPNIDWQMRYQCGCKEFDWAIPVASNNVLPIQFPIVAALVNGWTFLIHGELSVTSPSSSFISTVATADGEHAWLTFSNYGSAIPSTCDTYYIEFRNTALGSVSFFSERFRRYELNDKEKIYRLEFKNDTDVDGILYQTGYIQRAYLMGCVFDTPNVVEANENITDGDAVEVPTFQSIQRRAVLKFPYFPDFWQGVFHRLKMHSFVILTKEDTDELITINGKNIQFTTEEQDVCFTKGVLSWIESTQVMTNCSENYTILV